MLTTQDAKQVVLDYVDAFNSGDMDKLERLLAPDAEIQGVLGKGTFERVKPIWEQLITGYNMQIQVEDLVAEGNMVAARYVETGSFTKPAFGNEPTARPIGW
jgi:ketosteroid isomerase-like protein